MNKFFLGIITGSMSMSFAWMYLFRWTILEVIAAGLDVLLSEKRSMNRMEHREHLARARARRRLQYGPNTPKR
jgi:hypothetical protein